MRKQISLVPLLILLSFVLYSQDSNTVRISGRVLSAGDSLPIEKATVIIFKANKAKYILADNQGSFSITYNNIPDSIKITSIGFLEFKTSMIPTGQIQLGNLYLEKSAIQLQDVTVVGKKLVTFDFNKITYNVSADPDNNGLNGLEVIQKAPLIDVTPGNKIYVNGKGTFIILLNGRSSGISGTDPAPFLKAIPASYLAKIEISTDPPAKYKLEGYDYVINIITSKKLVDGVFGSVNGGVNSFGGYDGGGIVMMKKRKLSLTTNLSYSRIIGKESDVYQSNDNIVEGYKNVQSGIQLNKSHAFTGSAEFTYEIDTVKLLSLNVYKSFSKLNSDNFSNNYYYNSAVLYNQVFRNGRNKDDNGFNYITLDYEILKNKKRDILTFSGKLFQNHFTNQVNYIDNSVMYNDIDTLRFGANSKGYEYTAQIDYSKFISQASRFELGVKEIYRDYETYNAIDGSKNSVLDYSQLVSMLYSSISLSKKKNYYKVGIGLNYTNIEFAENHAPSNTTKDFFNPTPYLNYSRNLKKNKSLSFNYSLTTRRPGVTYISSAIKYTNIENLQGGNPNLKPELFHNFMLSFNTFLKKKAFILGMYANTSGNSIVEIIKPYQDSLSLRTYSNGGKYVSIGNTIYYSQTFFKKLTFRLNSDISYVKLSNDDNDLDNDGITYRVFLTLSYKLPWNLRFSAQNFIYGQTISLQGEKDNFSDLRFYLARNFMNDKLSVGLSLYQPYSNRVKLESKYRDAQFINYSFTNFPARYVGISLSYDFGDFSKVMKRDKNKTINNDDIKQ